MANHDGSYAAERQVGEDGQPSEDDGLEDATVEMRETGEDLHHVTPDTEEMFTVGAAAGGTAWKEDAAPEVQIESLGRRSS